MTQVIVAKSINYHRILWADALKAFAILFVMMGHVLPWCMGNALNGMIMSYITVLQMPLFMIISGYCSYKPIVSWDIVKRRSFQLIVPFLCWPLVWRVISMDFTGFMDYYPHLLLFPDTGLWFLFVLFLITVVDCIRNRIVTNCNIKITPPIKDYLSLLTTESFLLVLFWLYKRCGLSGNWINFVALYYPYYSIGGIMRRNNDLLLKHLPWVGCIGLIVYLVETPFRSGYLWQIPLAICGTFGAFLIFYKFCDRPQHPMVKFTGMSTLGIYAVHQPVIAYLKHKIVTEPLWLDVLLTFVLTYTVSIAVVWLFKRNKVTAFLFLGTSLKRK